VRRKQLTHPSIWAFTTYFTEGFPFTLIRTVSSVFFRDRQVSLEGIGLTSLYGLPWVLKFLWSPMLDTTGTKRRWLLLTQGTLAALMVAVSFLTPLQHAVPWIAGLWFLGAIVSATHDTAIDGYYMEALDADGQARYVGYRVMAYRIAMMTGTGVIVTIGTTAGWLAAFLTAAIVFTLFFLYHVLFLPEPQTPARPFQDLLKNLFRVRFLVGALLLSGVALAVRAWRHSSWYEEMVRTIPFLSHLNFSTVVGLLLLLTLIILVLVRRRILSLLNRHGDNNYARAFLTFVDRPGVGPMLGFILTLRAGEWMLTTMVAPFIVDLGIKQHYGWISAVAGLPSSIVGAMIGGWLIARYSLRRTIWPLIFIQNLTNLCYMALAFYLSSWIHINTGNPSPVPIGTANIALVAAVHGFEQFSGGLGTAVLMTYLMRICRKEFKASHYAIGSGLMSASGLFAGLASGFLASWLGYGWMFGCSFLVAVPAMLMIPWLPMLDPVPDPR